MSIDEYYYPRYNQKSSFLSLIRLERGEMPCSGKKGLHHKLGHPIVICIEIGSQNMKTYMILQHA